MKKPAIRWILVRGVAIPALLALFILALASFFPIRLDVRSFQKLVPLLSLLEKPVHSTLYVSSTNDMSSYDRLSYGISQFIFPNAQREWLTLKENVSQLEPGSFAAVDQAGNVYWVLTGPDGWHWSPPSRQLLQRAEWSHWDVIYESAELRATVEARLADIRLAQRVRVIPPDITTPSVSIRAIHNEFSLARWFRLLAILGSLICLSSLPGSSDGNHWSTQLLLRSGAAGAAVCAQIGAFYLGDLVHQRGGGIAQFVLWLSLIAGMIILARKGRLDERPRLASSVTVPTVAGMILYCAMLVLTLDFDGDTYTTYIPVARLMYQIGHHDPHAPALASIVQGGSYPPGYPVLIAISMWVANLPRDGGMLLGTDASYAILIYRLLIAFCSASAVLAIAAASVRSRAPSAALLVSTGLAAVFIAPTLRGQHIGAETLIVPIFVIALSCVSSSDSRVLTLGLVTAGALPFIKQDGMVYLLFLALPAFATVIDRARLRRIVFLAAGLIPFLTWAASRPPHNRAFDVHRLGSQVWFAQLKLASFETLRLLLHSNGWPLLLLALPLCIAARLARERSLKNLLLPLGIIAVSCGWVIVYSVSLLPLASHIETSYPRLMVAPELACLLWVIRSVQEGEAVG